MATSFIVEFPKSRGGTGRSLTKNKLAVKDSKFDIEPSKSVLKDKETADDAYIFHAEKDTGRSPWDEAHDIFDSMVKEGKIPEYAEPDQEQLLFDPSTLPKARMAGSTGYLTNWPKPDDHDHHELAWHLNDQHSQLKRAREIAEPYFKAGKVVKIGHLDTGFDPQHPCKPRNLNLKEAFCFVEGRQGNYAFDVETGTSVEQQWHGTATLAFLAGGYVDSFDGKTPFGMDFGGAPLADVVPIRISDTVVLLKTSAFAEALEYATDIGCEVITMSMAGLPSMRWARAVNRAYEKGMTMVVAAGNSWVTGPKKLLPSCVVYPGRWDRVIAATGIACNNFPYVFDANPHMKSPEKDGLSHSEFMQGNFGPPSAMKTALAAYTPNLPWAARNPDGSFWALSGGGTSSATPQIAAAAALWVQRFRKELDAAGFSGTWKQAEAVRYGLFNSANKNLPDYEKFYGNGALRAADALDPKWFPKDSDLKMSEPADLFLPFLELFFGGQRGAPADALREEMYATELLQLAHTNPDLQKLLTVDVTEKDLQTGENLPDNELLWELRRAIKQSDCSEKLKQFLGLQ